MGKSSSVRRSFALPRALLDEVIAAAPPELQHNLNGLVKEALREYVARRREEEFARAMAAMAKDEHVVRESRLISEQFQAAEGDGL